MKFMSKWRPEEDDFLVRHYPDYRAIHMHFPDKTLNALWSRAKYLGIQRRKRMWTAAEVRRLIKQSREMSLRELFDAHPDRSQNQIRHHLRMAGALKRDAPALSGIELVDDMRRRCRDSSVSVRALGRFIRVKGALDLRIHAGCKSLEAKWTADAARALGGELYVEWDD